MGLLSSFFAKVAPDSPLSHTFFPPPTKFKPTRDIPDLSGKTVIVTGANTGLGYETVRAVLIKNANVYLAARDPAKATEAAQKLKAETGKEPQLLQLDLADLHSVRRAAQEFLRKEDKLDILFNNAGVMIPPSDQLTAQGYDLQFGVGVLGHYFLTSLLLPALERSTVANGQKARIVNISSTGHLYAPKDGIEWSVLKDGPERRAKIKEWGDATTPGKGSRWKLYGISKMGNIFITKIFNRYHGDKVAAYSIHPGGAYTELQRYSGSAFVQRIYKAVLFTPAQGAITQLWVGTMPEATNMVGEYFIPWARISNADPRAENKKTQDALKNYLDEQINALSD